MLKGCKNCWEIVNDILKFCKGGVKELLRATKQIYIFYRYFSVSSKTLKNDLIVLFYKNFKILNNYLDSLLKIQA